MGEAGSPWEGVIFSARSSRQEHARSSTEADALKSMEPSRGPRLLVSSALWITRALAMAIIVFAFFAFRVEHRVGLQVASGAPEVVSVAAASKVGLLIGYGILVLPFIGIESWLRAKRRDLVSDARPPTI